MHLEGAIPRVYGSPTVNWVGTQGESQAHCSERELGQAGNMVGVYSV